MDILKPLDVVVALKIGCNESRQRKLENGGVLEDIAIPYEFNDSHITSLRDYVDDSKSLNSVEGFLEDHQLPEPTNEQFEDHFATNSVGDLSRDLYKAKGDISRSLKRLISLELISERSPKEEEVRISNRKYYSLRRNEMMNFLLYGIRHVFSSDKKGVGRGLATGWNNPSITSEMNPPEMPLVWSHSYGNVVGELLEPLYAGVPDAASRDKQLYVLLSLIDILRTGKPRELKHAKELLIDKIEDLYR